jgi:hypothetical protein
MKHPFFRESKCLGTWLHRFKIVEEYPDGVLELCEVCQKTKFFKLIDGKVDNLAYMDYHIRNAIPPFHPLFEHEYLYDLFAEEPIISPYA